MQIQKLKTLYEGRIDELLGKLDSDYRIATVEACFLGTLAILQSLYGANSTQVGTFVECRKSSGRAVDDPVDRALWLSHSIIGALKNTREELQQGLIRNMSREATGEVLGDLVALAQAELQEGYGHVAAVLACAALEDALKHKAGEFGMEVEGKTLDAMINFLKKNSFFKGAQAPIVGSYVKLRNAAMHADWNKIQQAEVGSLIGFLDQFLLEHYA